MEPNEIEQMMRNAIAFLEQLIALYRQTMRLYNLATALWQWVRQPP